MAIKKTELYSSLWQSCDELRGGMDASQYKDYILTLLFMKYVSDKYAGDPYGLIAVPEGGSFADMVKLKGDKEIGDKVNKIISTLAEENDLKGVIDVADFNDEDKLGRGKEMVDRLSKLVGIFEGLNLGANRAEGDDLLGDAYEYLMRHFATESGKSKGQFYTPAEVSRIMAKVVGITPETRQDQTVYDPTCGSGSLLLKSADEAPHGLSIYGQEMDNATAALARMNMILHNNPTAEIWQDNTLAAPHWLEADDRLKTFDFAVANPPFSYKAWSNGLNPTDDEFERFAYGIPPAKNGDYAFLLHLVKSLKSTGKGAIILPHGVLFRGNVEAAIRRNLIRQGYIKGIIGLPANLFYGTGIPACIIVLDKEQAHTRTGIFMVDASQGFIKDGNKNRLRSRDLHKIVDVFTRQLEVPGYARLVPYSEIEQNEYNLNIPRYIDSSEPEDRHDLNAHLNGGIPNRDITALDDYWQVFPTLRRSLFAGNGREGYSDPLVAAGQVKSTILNHPEFSAFAARTLARYHAWRDAHASRLNALDVGAEPKALIHELAEDLLARFSEAELVDPYAIYQLLMDYWRETMQDDVYLIAQDGWRAGSVLRELVAEKGQRSPETPDLVINKKKYKADLIPPALLVARYFAAELAALEQLQADKDALSQELESLLEEHSGEEGLLAEAATDKGNVTKTTLNARMKQLTVDRGQLTVGDDDGAELALLEQVQRLMAQETAADRAVKAAQKALDEAVFAHYPHLTEADIKTLVITDKWQTALQSAIQSEIERVTQHLAQRVQQLAERYAEPLPQIVDEVAALSGKVDGHLQRMGL
ncbi:MAG: type I restriction-modification system subunit M [Anaerolineae bacterium]|nr:type I restriction-modification system subunit M [Anaerolineae bacterium]